MKTMVTGKQKVVKRNHRINKIMPLTESQRTLMRWLLDFCDSLEFSGSEEASYNYANDRAGWQLGRLWSGNDPQCLRRWRGSEQVEQPYETHDMELAQDDFDRYGFQYVRPGEGFSYRGEE